MSKKIILILLVTGLFASSCTDGGRKENMGTMLGTVGGAIIGSQFGKGPGTLITMGLGAAVGAMLGGSLGRNMDKRDKQLHSLASQNALENAPDGKLISWRNPNNGHNGYITPIKTYQKMEGEYCREFQQVVKVNGKDQSAYGTACRKPDGSWQIVQQN